MALSGRLKELRKEKGLSQKELAEITGLSLHAINSYESGRREPNSFAMSTLERFFSVSGEYLRGEIKKSVFFENSKLIQDNLDVLYEKLSEFKAEFSCSSQNTQKLAAEALSQLITIVTKGVLHSDEHFYISTDELRTLLSSFIDLNNTGRAELVKRAVELTQLSKYSSTDTQNPALTPQITQFVPPVHKTEKRYDVDGSRTREVMMFDLPASAGTGQFLDSDDFEMVTVDDDVPLNTSFGVRISGDSMEPDYPNGSIVWVKRQLEIRNGQIGIFVLNGESYCKKFSTINNVTKLVSINPKYAPLVIKDDDDLRCYGLVLAVSIDLQKTTR